MNCVNLDLNIDKMLSENYTMNIRKTPRTSFFKNHIYPPCLPAITGAPPDVQAITFVNKIRAFLK